MEMRDWALILLLWWSFMDSFQMLRLHTKLDALGRRR